MGNYQSCIASFASIRMIYRAIKFTWQHPKIYHRPANILTYDI